MYIKIDYAITQPIIKVTTSTSNVYVKVVSPAPVFINVGNAYITMLEQLMDVSANNPSDGDVLQYVSSTGLWTKTSSINFGSW
jgi:hypothetical protein